MNDTSIRKQVFKLLAAYTVLLFVSFCAIALMFAFVVEDEIIERLMIQQGNNVLEQYESSGVYPTPALSGFTVYTSIDQMPDIVQASYRPAPRVFEVFTSDYHHYHVLTLATGAVLVADVSALLVVSNPPAGWLVILGISLTTLLLLAIILSHWITRVTTRPVILLSEEVKAFPDSVSHFTASDRRDEIGYLADCIETAVIDLNESLKRETDFTRDVSHELRTPLTILKNDVTTSAPGATRDRQLAAIDQMDRTINSLLAMARSESIEAEKFSLTALIEEAMLNNSRDLESGGFEVDMLFSEQWYITANRQLALLVINNLLINGIRHSSNGQLSIDIVEGDLVFSNLHGENAEPRNDIGVGIGQGLYLTQRICDVLGWTMEVIRSEDSHQVVIKAPISH